MEAWQAAQPGSPMLSQVQRAARRLCRSMGVDHDEAAWREGAQAALLARGPDGNNRDAWRSCLVADRLPSALPAEVVRLYLVTWDSTGAVERGLGQDAAHRPARGEPDQIAPRRAFWSSNQKARRGGYVHSHWHGGPLGMGWSCVGLWFGHSLVSRVGRGLNIGLVTDWSSQVGHGMLIGWPLFLRGLVGFASPCTRDQTNTCDNACSMF